MKITDYKGYEIGYNPYTREFSGGGKSFPTQIEAEQYIDRLVKTAKEDFERIPAIRFGGWNERPVFGIITSFIDSEYVWFSQDGKRSKEHIKYLFADTPSNRNLVSRWIELTAAIVKLERERNAITLTDPIQAKKTEVK